jgi:hypothetical protein
VGATPRHPAQPPAALAAGQVRTVSELAAVLRWLRRRQAWSRCAAPLTYRELATVTGWSYGIFSGYFRGTVLPPTDRFDTLVRLLGATPAEQARLATVRDGVADRRQGAPGEDPTEIEPDDRLSAALLDSAPTGELLGRIERELRSVGSCYIRSGPLACAGRLTETVARLDLLGERSLGRAARRDRDLLAGIAHRLLGHAHYDLGNRAASFAHGHAALRHADRAGHPALRAHALDLLTGVAHRAGAQEAALRYARQGLRHVHHDQGDVAVALLVGEARASAALGDRRRAYRAVREAGHVLDLCEPDEVSLTADVLRFNRPVYAFQAADLLVDLPGQASAAESYARRSIVAHDRGSTPGPSSARYQAVSYLTLARCLVHRHDLAGAAEAVEGMPELRPADLIETVVLAAARVRAALAGTRGATALVAALAERVPGSN